MSEILTNPPTVIWSHSNRQADFYELPTDGYEIHESIGWLLNHYKSVSLWMGLESEDGAELFLICSPTQPADVVARLRVRDSDLSVFDVPISLSTSDS
ncbi:hypothetical protein N9X20_03740 [Opitutales bacterium]|nr:hypothetical protein [Opitutales bacterium]MDB2506640.1 hypothetical protein [Opitutales bacterium]